MTEMHRFGYTNIPEMRSRDTVVFQVLCSSMSYSHGPSILEQALGLGMRTIISPLITVLLLVIKQPLK
jgi:hypothetical protein